MDLVAHWKKRWVPPALLEVDQTVQQGLDLVVRWAAGTVTVLLEVEVAVLLAA